MKLKLITMTPKDHCDEYMTVVGEASWYNISREPVYMRYYGSGTTWWESGTDARVDDWTSQTLHDLWSKELNTRLEEKNCKKPKC